MDIVRVCDANGWTYQQYVDYFYKQPKWFIELMGLKHQADQELEARKKKINS